MPAMNEIQMMEKHFQGVNTILQTTVELVNKLSGVFNNLNSASQKTRVVFLKTAKAQQENIITTKEVSKKTEELTSLQKALGLELRKNGDYYNSSGKRVNKWGELLNKNGEVIGEFNRRSSLLNSTISEFGEKGTGVPFLKGFATYTKAGGNSLEYFSEFLTSTREELTIFGIEAGKARRFMYGFLPPGMFRLVNKTSTSFQFLGGTYRKMFADTKKTKEMLEIYRTEIEKMDKSSEEYAQTKAKMNELEQEISPNFFSLIGKTIKGVDESFKFLFKSSIKYAEGMKDADTKTEKFKKGLGTFSSVAKDLALSPLFPITDLTKGYYQLNKMNKLVKEGKQNAQELKKEQEKISKEYRRRRKILKEEYDNTIKLKEEAGELTDDVREKLKEELKIKQQIAREEMQMENALANAKNKGLNKLKEEIKLNKKNIQARKDALKNTQKESKSARLAVKERRKEIEKLEKQISSGQFDNSRLLKKKEQELKDARMQLKQQTADKNKILSKRQQYRDEIIEIEEKQKGATSQLELLKTARKEVFGKIIDSHPTLKLIKRVVKFYGGIGTLIRVVLQFLGKALIYFSLVILGIIVFIKMFGPSIKAAIEPFKKLFELAWPILSQMIGLISEGIKMVVNSLFGDGTLTDALDGLVKIAFGLLGFAVGVIITFAVALGAAAVVFVGNLYERGKEFLKDKFNDIKEGGIKELSKTLTIIGALVAGITAIILGAPVWLVGLIGVALYGVVKWAIPWALRKLKFFAEGGVTTGGLSVVGEKGPELVNLPSGSRVHSNKDSQKILSQSGGTVNNFNITINARDTSDSEMRRIAQQISTMVNNNINRSVSSSGLR